MKIEPKYFRLSAEVFRQGCQNCILLVQENILRKTYFEVYKFLTFLGYEQKICLIFIEYFFFKIIKNAFSLSRGMFCGFFLKF